MAVTFLRRDLTADGKYLCDLRADTLGELTTTGLANGSFAYVVAAGTVYVLLSGAWAQIYTGSGTGNNVLDVRGTAVTINNSLAETTIYSYTIAGGLVGANNKLRLELWNEFFNNTGAGRGYIIKVKLGGTTVIEYTTGAAAYTGSAIRRQTGIAVILQAKNSTSSQFIGLLHDQTEFAGAFGTLTTGVGERMTTGRSWMRVKSADTVQDMTTSKLLEVTITLSTNSATLEWVMNSASLEKL